MAIDFNSPQFQDYLTQIQEFPLEDICDELGIDSRRKGSTLQIICPFHNDTSFGSCIIKNNRMYCFACGESADGIKIVRHTMNVPFMDACRYIGRLGNIPEPNSSGSSQTYTKPELPVTDEQLDVLGLLKNNRILKITSFAETAVEFQKDKGNHIYDPDGYCLCEPEKISLVDLYTEDPMGFHSLIIGKVFERLTEMISTYMVTDYTSNALKEETERIIEKVLWPLATYYRPVAHTYVAYEDENKVPHYYNFSFMDSYKRRISNFIDWDE